MSNRLGNQVLEELRRGLREQMNAFSDNMLDGGCKDFAEYQLNVGIIRGLALAERDLIEMDDRMTKE